jgi:hypothetical protein
VWHTDSARHLFADDGTEKELVADKRRAEKLSAFRLTRLKKIAPSHDATVSRSNAPRDSVQNTEKVGEYGGNGSAGRGRPYP